MTWHEAIRGARSNKLEYSARKILSALDYESRLRRILSAIAALIEDGGQITLGALHPIKCVAIANDDHNSLAMLQRRPGETLLQLLERLDAAVNLAWNADQFTDEINPPFPSSNKR